MFVHESVLKSEAIAGLDIKPHGTYVDCTVGGGGHAFEIASRLNNQGRLIAFDQDIDALKAAQEKLAPFEKKVTFINENFRHLETALLDRRIDQVRSEEHTSELQSRGHLVCRLLLEKKKKNIKDRYL